MRFSRRFLAFVLLPATVLPTPGEAVVRRCIAPDGTTIYTDRACELLGATDAAPTRPDPGHSPGSTTTTGPGEIPENERPLSSYGLASEDCARTPEHLLEHLRQSVQERNVNALAGFYHWPGMGKWGARNIMDRLESLILRSDGIGELVYDEAAFVVFNPAAWPDVPPEDPVGVRLALWQEGSGEAIGSIELHLIRSVGCWWFRF